MASKSTLLHVEKEQVHRLYDSADTIRDRGSALVGFLGLGTFLGWLASAFKQHPGLLADADTYIWQSCLILYFTSWVAGVKRDGAVQRKVYVSAPEALKPGLVDYLIAAMIFGLFALMFVAATLSTFVATGAPTDIFATHALATASRTEWIVGFVIFLNLLWFLNVPMWRYYIRTFIGPQEVRSERRYREAGDHVGILKIRIVGGYIKGAWQWYRFAAGGLLLIACDIMLWQWWQAISDIRPALVVALAVFLALVETWVWSMRLKVSYSMRYVEELAREFQITPRGVAESGAGDGA